jgi:hypothetical protein
MEIPKRKLSRGLKNDQTRLLEKSTLIERKKLLLNEKDVKVVS